MCTIVLVTLWSAKIVSNLTVDIQTIPIKTFDDLLNQDTYTFGMHGAANVVIQFSTSNNPRDKKLWAKLKELEKVDTDVLAESNAKLIEQFKTENFVFIGTIRLLRTLASESCDYFVTNDEYQTNGVALRLQNNSAYKHYFNEFTLRMAESGIIQRQLKQLNPVKDCHNRVQTKREPISLELVLPIFSVLFCFVSVAFVTLILESLLKCK